MKITKLTDIEIYNDALQTAQLTFRLTTQTPICNEYALVDQMKRASLSVAANIAEGYGRKTKRDFSQFLSIALGSANELIAYLDFIALEFAIITTELKEKYSILSRRIHAFRTYLLTHS